MAIKMENFEGGSDRQIFSATCLLAFFGRVILGDIDSPNAFKVLLRSFSWLTRPLFLRLPLCRCAGRALKVSGDVAKKKGRFIIKTLMQRLEKGEPWEDVRHLGNTMKAVDGGAGGPAPPEVD